jgi:WD repeat-containing protein 55
VGQLINRFQAHEDSINKLCLLDGDSPYLIASGDDSGCVKVWDMRSSRSVMEWHLHEDFIAALHYYPDDKSLYSTAGDATLAWCDLRKPSTMVRSDDQEDEMHAISVLKNGKKIVCGAQDGTLLVFSKDRYGDISDRFPGHPSAINCLLKIDETTLLTGAEDGLIRVVSVQPNTVLGVIGDHESFPVEGFAFTQNRDMLASYSHDSCVRFWDLEILREDEGDDINDGGDGGSTSDEGITGAEGGDMIEKEEEGDEEGEEMEVDSGGDDDDDDDDDESSCSSSDEETAKGTTGRKKLPTANEKFYSDL